MAMKMRWHRFSNTLVIKTTTMEMALNITDSLTKEFDKELREILIQDLKKFKAENGKFLSNNQANTQDNDLLVA
jgi:hypothetical protein